MPISNDQINKCVAVVREFGATRLILFGSALENPDTAQDIDLACDGVEGWKLFELGARLEELLSVPVDLVPLSPPTRFTRYVEKKGAYHL
ncbi:MAG: DNA polymerase III subunit beta [candidate division KSB1 bacterium]|nr:DNA polymerase III subunit beta [candidate division KSB1 bacterium]